MAKHRKQYEQNIGNLRDFLKEQGTYKELQLNVLAFM